MLFLKICYTNNDNVYAQVQLVCKEVQVQQVFQASPVSLVPQDHLVLSELQVPLVRRARLVHLDKEVLPVLEEALDFLERQDRLAFVDLMDHPAALEQQGGLGCVEVLDQLELWAILAHRDHLELQV